MVGTGEKSRLDLSKREASDPTMISFDLMFDAALASKQRRSEMRRKRCKEEICQTFSSIHSCTDHQTDNDNGKVDIDEKRDGDWGERFFVERETGWNVGKVTQSCTSMSIKLFHFLLT